MSTPEQPKREPLLIDTELDGLCPYGTKQDSYGPWYEGAEDVRAWYEGQIASGKLRVVEEVDAMCGDHGGIEGCSCSECGAPVMPEAWMFCQGCGNKVRQ